LLVHAILLFLDGLNDFVLRLGVVGAAIAVAGDLVGGVGLGPLDLCHVHPSFRLWLDLDRWLGSVHIGGTTHVLSTRSQLGIKVLKTREACELLRLRHNDYATLKRQLQRCFHWLTIY